MDLYLKAPTEADMTAALVDAGLAYLDEDALHPATSVSLDVIGPISRVIDYDEDGDPVIQLYPEWHVNVRCGGLSEEQEALLEAVKIVPPEVPFRVWA